MSSEKVTGVSVWGIGPKADLFDRAVSLGYTMESAARVAEGLDTVSGIIDPCANHPGMSTSIRDGYTVDSCEACDVIILSTDAGYTAETGRSGIDVLTDLLTIPTPQAAPVNLLSFHKVSAPMVSVMLAMASMRGEVDAAHMHRSILPTGTGTTKATLKALMRRDLVAEVIRDNDGSPGSLVAYVLTASGLAVVAALGCPVEFLPTDPSAADRLVAEVGYTDCDQECAQVMAAGASALPVGGMVCFGCGSVFVRGGAEIHPGTVAVSNAVIRRNRRKGLI